MHSFFRHAYLADDIFISAFRRTDDQFRVSREEFRNMTASRRASFMFRKNVHWAIEGSLLSLPIMALSTATAQRGEKAAAFASTASSLITFPATMGAIGAAVSLIPGIGPGVATALSFLGAMYPSSKVDEGVNRAVRTYSRFGANVRRLEMGGDFVDSESAARSRMRAVQDMSAALINNRRYLGQEARLLHR